jgi:Spy/CpxP family protein refolding chaperone
MNLRLKHVIPAFLIGLAVGASVNTWRCSAQRHRSAAPEKRSERLVKRLDKELKLTPEQREKIVHIFAATRERMDALRNQVYPRFEEVRNDTDNQIETVLTPEQLPKFREMRRKWNERRRESRPGPPPY